MLKIENLVKSFPGSVTPVLNSLNLEVFQGEFVVILGSNGSGKTTLLKCLAGEHQVNSGTIKLDNNDITRKKIYQCATDISFVSQDTSHGTAIDMTVLENMCLSLGRGMSAKFRFYNSQRDLVLTKIKELGIGLENAIDKKMSLLSGGQRQTISTLMAFDPIPKLLLLDEHTSALDPKSRNVLMEYTNNLIERNNITSLMITHNIDDAIKYGNRLIIMQHGDIVHDARAAEKKKLTSADILDVLHRNEDFGANLENA